MNWFVNLKLRTKLLAMAGFIIAGMVLLASYNLTVMGKIGAMGEHLYAHDTVQVETVLDARAAFINVAAGVYHHLVGEEGKRTYDDMEKLIAAQSEILVKDLKRASDLVDPANKPLIQEVQACLAPYLEAMPELLRLSRAGQKEEAIAVAARMKPYRTKATAKLDELVETVKKGTEAQFRQNRALDVSARRTSVMALAAAALAALLVALWVAGLVVGPLRKVQAVARFLAEGDLSHRVEHQSRDEVGRMAADVNQAVDNLRHLVGQVAHTAEQVAGSSEELASSAQQVGEVTQQVTETVQQVAKGSDEQAKAAQQTSEVVDQMSGSITQVAGATQQMARDADSVVTTANDGQKAVAQAVSQMNAIKDSSLAAGQAVKRLGDQSHEIGQIVEVITGIADQTNLLALNAAIEAARAGEQGRGFAVVAEEVRKLAEQSRQAAEQISGLVREIQTDTGRAVAMMDSGSKEVEQGTLVVARTGDAFSAIAGAVETVVGQIQEVSAAAQQLSAGSQQVVRAVENIAAITEESAAGAQEVSASSEEQAASVEEIAASAESLAQLAQELQTTVARFRL